MNETTGKIHSIESFGTADGPGIRFVVFLQGCPLRCLYCHNPDTWDASAPAKYTYTPQQLVDEALRYKSFIRNGGVTLTGGEPLMQAAFAAEFFELAHVAGLHTALDTSGAIFTSAAQDALRKSDIVLLDIKALDNDMAQKLTGHSNANTLRTLDFLEENRIPTWIRHVVVPGYTHDTARLTALADFLLKYKTIEKIEILPYHTLGTFKYEKLGIDYPLAGVEPLARDEAEKVRQTFRERGFAVQ